jgi:hypothetical protein
MQHHEGEPNQTPEQRERLLIDTILIPADEREPVRLNEVEPRLTNYQQLVGGYIEAISLEQPPLNLYLNEEGKVNELPTNRRATLLLWMHHPAFRYADYVAGDAFLTGPTDSSGNDTDVPGSFAQVLLRNNSFRVEVQTHGDSAWHGSTRTFDNWVAAYSYALRLGQRLPGIEDIRVVPKT